MTPHCSLKLPTVKLTFWVELMHVLYLCISNQSHNFQDSSRRRNAGVFSKLASARRDLHKLHSHRIIYRAAVAERIFCDRVT